MKVEGAAQAKVQTTGLHDTWRRAITLDYIAQPAAAPCPNSGGGERIELLRNGCTIGAFIPSFPESAHGPVQRPGSGLRTGRP
ncbi:hypothetical protein [Chitinimonas sp.]|uniref:hypothetical protein n=1 Tax=Chitinimonas sp. TaxID=1934313 RepID=UPI0035B3FE5F